MTPPLTPPLLTFFCELGDDALEALFARPEVIEDLQRLSAGASLATLELSPKRGGMVRRLNEAGIPVAAWLLLPKEQGYFLTMDNLPQMMARYAAFSPSPALLKTRPSNTVAAGSAVLRIIGPTAC